MRHNLPLLSFVLLAALSASGQRVVDISSGDVDVVTQQRPIGLAGGSIFPEYKYIKVKEGSPYYRDEWCKGILVTENGTAFHGLELKLDLLNHEVHYKDSADREMVLTTPMRKIIIWPGLDARTFIPGKPWASTDKSLEKAWLQVLVNDSVSLLLDIRKKLVEITPYASSTAEQTINDEEAYWLQKGGNLVRIKHWDDLPYLLGDKKGQVAKFIKENDLTGDAPIEYADVVAFYNTLLTPAAGKK